MQFEDKLKDDLEQLTKKKKFGRDELNYKEYEVYLWPQKNERFQPQRRRSVSFNLPSSDDDQSVSETSPKRD